MTKKPTIIEISVKAMDDEGIEKEFYFCSMDEFKNWWKQPYKNKCPDMDSDGTCLLSAPDTCLHKDIETGDCCKDE